MRSFFKDLNPVPKAVYFAAVIILSCISLHPFILFISGLGAFLSLYAVAGAEKAFGNLHRICLPGVIILTGVNVLFNHYGVTTLARFPGGNALTLEAIIYGLALSVLTVNVLTWCRVLSDTMNSESFLYIFGGLAPDICISLTLALRFIPLIIDEYRQTIAARRQFESTGAVFAVHNLSAVIIRSLERSVQTAQAMKMRGLGSSKRTDFSLYFMSRRDWAVILFCMIFAGGSFAGVMGGLFYARYNPVIKIDFARGASQYGAAFVLALLFLFPFISSVLERRLIWEKY